MDLDARLVGNFLFLVELCKDPKKVFCNDQRSFNLAQQWLDKLCRYQCSDLNDRRLRNVYMSHLCVCLNMGKLTGPFVIPPNKRKLEEVHFDETATRADNVEQNNSASCSQALAEAFARVASPQPCGSSAGGNSFDAPQVCAAPTATFNDNAAAAWQIPTPSPPRSVNQQQPFAAQNTFANSATPATQTAFERDTTDRNKCFCSNEASSLAGSGASSSAACDAASKRFEQDGRSQQKTFQNYTLHSMDNYPKCVGHYMEHTLYEDEVKDIDFKQDLKSAYLCKETLPTAVDAERTKCDLTELIRAITDEMCGISKPFSNPFLESELLRYKSFIMNYKNKLKKLKKLTTESKMRSFLLVNLQNDLMKLINESPRF